ncbi:MAG TPA: cation:proton antiporter [Pyrinomonadaceae bacterium]|jgi:CPA2 family monovalent cation:H+ antiporter-2|nr:cation:proton antiporter [Pyrinomonadaceae bacterium]
MEHLVLEFGLALALIGIAVSLAAKLRLSNVPFLILIGMAVGPHAPQIGVFDFRFVSSAPLIEFMGRVGVLFLLFYLGLESNVSRLIQAGRSIFIGGSIYIVLNFAIGVTYAYLTGFSPKEILIVAGITTISSSAIVAKILFDYRRTANPETELILGITMYEDVFLAVYLSLISGIVLSGATSLGGILSSAGLALGFIVGLIILGRWTTPLLNRLLRISSNEVFVIVVFAALFIFAGLGETIHVAEAIGALLLGLILGETEHSGRLEKLVVPFRDFFGAIFFFGFGLTVDPFGLGGAVALSIGAALLSLIGVIVAGQLAGRVAGHPAATSFNVGLTLLGRGEFSIIVAKLAEAGGLLPLIQPFAALYVLILATFAPLLAKESERIYNLVERILTRFRRKPRQDELSEVNSE